MPWRFCGNPDPQYTFPDGFSGNAGRDVNSTQRLLYESAYAWPIAEPESMFPETTEFKSTRLSGCGDLAQNSTGYRNSGSDLQPAISVAIPCIRALNEGSARMGWAGVVFLVDGQSEGGCGHRGFRWAAGSGDSEGITACGGSR